MKKRWIALALSLAVIAGAASVLAEEPEQVLPEAPDRATYTAGEPAADPARTEDGPEDMRLDVEESEEEEIASPAGPDDGGTEAEEPDLSEKARRAEERVLNQAENVTRELETLSGIGFDEIESRIRSSNLTVLGLEENLTGLRGMDYDKMEDDLRKNINGLTAAQDYLDLGVRFGDTKTVVQSSIAISSMESAMSSLVSTFQDLRDGKLQRSNLAVMRQLQNAEDQLVMAGESTYVALVAMEAQQEALERQLASLDRTVEELELRYKLGQVSALTLNETKTGRASLVSGLETLKMNIRNYKGQLEVLLGAAITGEIDLGGVPAVTAGQIAGMDVEADLKAAKEKSYDLYAAAQTLDESHESMLATGKQYNFNEKRDAYNMARHSWQGAQYTYNTTLQNYELKFRTLYNQVHDYYQALQAARRALTTKQESYKATELKYRQGTISRNALLTAQDELREAEEKVASTERDLFSSYNSYCWAVQHGTLN